MCSQTRHAASTRVSSALRAQCTGAERLHAQECFRSRHSCLNSDSDPAGVLGGEAHGTQLYMAQAAARASSPGRQTRCAGSTAPGAGAPLVLLAQHAVLEEECGQHHGAEEHDADGRADDLSGPVADGVHLGSAHGRGQPPSQVMQCMSASLLLESTLGAQCPGGRLGLDKA